MPTMTFPMNVNQMGATGGLPARAFRDSTLAASSQWHPSHPCSKTVSGLLCATAVSAVGTRSGPDNRRPPLTELAVTHIFAPVFR